MSSRTLPVLVGVALALASFVVTGGEATTHASQRNKPKIKMLTPKKGDVVHPGDVVTITWEYVNVDGRPPIDLGWCEQEIFLSLDGGRTNARRLTLALDPLTRSYEWTVPNTPTDRAVLDIHYGCESSDSPAEVPNKQMQAPFVIAPAVKNEGELALHRLPTQTRAGDALTLGWESTVVNPGPYTVSVSYDRGGEFIELGTTNATGFTWTVPTQFAGALTFKVSTVGRDGRTYESPVTPGSTTKVVR
jgi:hypothetical protein